MGEYATYEGESVKIGTCEDMYYLRYDQRFQVTAEVGNVDPVRDAGSLRFRFPFPHEDGTEPGNYDDYAHGLRVDGLSVPSGVEHYTVQFTASNGYLVSLPCPEGDSELYRGTDPLRVHKNGYGGAVQIVQQREWEGRLVTVAECKGCGAKYRLETVGMAEEAATLIRAMADRENQVAQRNGTPGNAAIADRLHLTADRLLAGYTVSV